MAQSPDCYILAVQWTHDTCWAQNVPLLDSKMLQLRAAEAFYMSYPAWRCLRARMVAGRLGSTGAERFSKRSSVFLERASRALLPGPLTRAPRRSDICSSPCCPPAQPVQAIRSTPRKQGCIICMRSRMTLAKSAWRSAQASSWSQCPEYSLPGPLTRALRKSDICSCPPAQPQYA